MQLTPVNEYTIFYQNPYLGYLIVAVIAVVVGIILGVLRRKFTKWFAIGFLGIAVIGCVGVYVLFSVVRVGWIYEVELLHVDAGVVEDLLVVNLETDTAIPIWLLYKDGRGNREILPTADLQDRRDHSFLVEDYQDGGKIYLLLDGEEYGVDYGALEVTSGRGEL